RSSRFSRCNRATSARKSAISWRICVSSSTAKAGLTKSRSGSRRRSSMTPSFYPKPSNQRKGNYTRQNGLDKHLQVRESPVEFLLLCFCERDFLRGSGNTIPDFLNQQETIGNAQPINSKRLHGDGHRSPSEPNGVAENRLTCGFATHVLSHAQLGPCPL